MNDIEQYNELMRRRNEFISESKKPLVALEKEVRLLKAELVLFVNCKSKTGSTKYDHRIKNTRDDVMEKEGQLALLKQENEDAKQEIEMLEQLIEMEISKEKAIEA